MKTSKKFLTAAITLIIALVVLAGCGSSDDNVSTYGNAAQNNNPHGAPPHVQNQPTSNQPTSTPATTPSPTANAPTATPAPTAEPIQEVASQWNHAFTGVTAFSEGLAWVAYGGGASVIDTNSNIVFSIEGNILHFTPFENGVSFYVTGRPGVVESFEYFIVDRTGTVTFSSVGQTHAVYILAQGPSSFVVAEHETGFAVNEWRLRTIDRNGNDIFPPFANEDAEIDTLHLIHFMAHEYIGEGVFALRFRHTTGSSSSVWTELFDVENSRLLHVDMSQHVDFFASPMQNGEILIIRITLGPEGLTCFPCLMAAHAATGGRLLI